jgi:CHAD domain-containing protein
MADASSTARDLQVQRAWIAGTRAGISEAEQAGVRWLLTRLEPRQLAANGRLEKALDRRYDRAVRRMDAAFSRIGGETPLGRRESISTRRVLRRKVASHGEELVRRLGMILDADSAAEIHDARKAAKRLRYLLEPFAAELPSVEPILARLRSLQDLLGEIHDRHGVATVLADGIGKTAAALAVERARELLPGVNHDGAGPDLSAARAQPGVLALAGVVGTEITGYFATLRNEWLGGRARPLIEQLTAVLDRAGKPDPEARPMRPMVLSSVPS